MAGAASAEDAPATPARVPTWISSSATFTPWKAAVGSSAVAVGAAAATSATDRGGSKDTSCQDDHGHTPSARRSSSSSSNRSRRSKRSPRWAPAASSPARPQPRFRRWSRPARRAAWTRSAGRPVPRTAPHPPRSRRPTWRSHPAVLVVWSTCVPRVPRPRVALLQLQASRAAVRLPRSHYTRSSLG
eukprot:scaffold407_cov245-Prasinococcus_capsulatus_cf.AAC.3